MRVLTTADTIGGVWTYALELARALGDVEFTIATMGEPATSDQRRDAAALANVQLVESRYRLEWMDDPWDDVDRAGEWLLQLAETVRPDLVHLNDYSHAALPWPVPRLVVAHSCVFSWWRAVHRELPPPSWSTYFERVRRGIAACDLLVAPSWAMLDEVRTIYGGAARDRVIHNARSGTFRAAPKEPFVLSAGRVWDEAKNIAAVTRVAPSLAWPVRVAGAGAQSTLGLLSAEQMREQYAHAAIYCLPARYEPFGLSILEAALSHCALVIGDIPSLRELWDGAALFVPPEDDDALRDALQTLIADDERRLTLAGAAARRAQMFDPRSLRHRYRETYAELAA